MMIQSPEKKYIVIKYSFSDSNMERYVCQEETGGERYTIVRIKNRQWITGAVEFLMRQKENSHFTDFTSCFFSEECLYVVMRYAEGISLEEKLQNEESSLEERLAVGKGILERILILNMPDYFLKDCLKAESIILSASLEVRFQYELLNISDYERVLFWQVQNCLLKLFQMLFAKELKKKMLPPAIPFCDSLKKGGYQDILEIYTAYDKMCKEIQKLSADKEILPQTWSFRLWERAKKYIPALKRVCAVVLMVLAVIFLIYTVRESMQEGGEKKSFEYIGTLEIQ